MSISSSPLRLSLLSLSLLLAFGSQAYAQEAKPQLTPEMLAKIKQKQSEQAAQAKVGTSTANSQSTPSAPSTPQKVEISGSKGYDERRQDTASKIVVTQEEILKYGDTNLSDVLKRLPGVTVGGVQGRGGAIRMRGLGAGYTRIMLNGEPSPPGFSIDDIAPDNIERIEIFRSATAELSTQAIAGGINIILKKAIVTAQRELKVGMSEDNGKYGLNASLQMSDKVGRMSYSLSGNANHSNFSRPSNSEEIGKDANGKTILQRQSTGENQGTFEMIGLSPRVNWSLENGDMITSQSFINTNRFKSRSVNTTTTSIGDPAQLINDTSNSNSDSQTIRTNLNWVHKLEDSAKLDTRFGVNYRMRDSDSSLVGNGATQKLARTNVSSNDETEFTFGGKYTSSRVEGHSIAAGWDGAYSKSNDKNQQRDMVTGTPSTTIINPINTDENANADVSRLALFVQDEWEVTKAWSVYAGVRWEGIDTNSEGNTYGAVSNRSSVMSPILQTLYKIPGFKNDQIRVGLTRTYKAPDADNLTPRRSYSSNNSATSPDRMGNPNLKPELAWGLDTGYEHYLEGGGVLGVNMYIRRIEDFTRRTTSFIDGAWVSMPTNNGLATTQGIEFDAKFPLSAMLADAPAIDLRANLAFNFSKVDSVPGPNNRLDQQTPVSANFGADYKLTSMPLTFGGNLSFQSGGLVQISTTQSAYSIPKRVLDMYALWKFDNKTNLRVALGNALHQDNISSSTYVDAFGSLVRRGTSPTTTSVRINLEHKF
jgi:outer membrane receptor for ferrienterochelin and colicins